MEKAGNKQKLGQFYTTNYKHILQNMHIPNDICKIIEPFAGNGDLLNFIEKGIEVIQYDIDPKNKETIKQDTLLFPPNLDNSFVLTNPPYLARNKSTDKVLFDKYLVNDLYKCFIQILINSNCLGGILIIPLNFFCSIRIADIILRKNFIEKFSIMTINIFEEKVFNDTTIVVCCFQFTRNTDKVKTNCFIYPSLKKIEFELNSENNYTIGGEMYMLPQNENYKINRATRLISDQTTFTNILLKCIDNNSGNKIQLQIIGDDVKEKYIDKTTDLSNRSYAILVIEPTISVELQEKLVKKFNKFFNEKREKYNSLFISNYRESSNSFARKRISFKLAYEIVNFLLNDDK
jgi:hypothetical protein